MSRVTPEQIEGVRRLLSERPRGGLRPVEIPRAVLDILAQYLFDLADLQAAVDDLLKSIDGGRCQKCCGRGNYYPECSLCGDSTNDHDCPSPRECEDCEGKGVMPKAAAVIKLLR